MITALIAVASSAAYLAVGWRLAIRNLPHAWEYMRRACYYNGGSVRNRVRAWTAGLFLFWPCFLAVRAIAATWRHSLRALDRMINAGDPGRDLRQAELERKR